MKEVNDIDELEAMLAGLSDDDLAELEALDSPTVIEPEAAAPRPKPVTDDDVIDAEILAELDNEPVVEKPKQTRRKRNLKPIVDEEPVNTEVEDAAKLEAFAEQVIDLMTVLCDEFVMDPDDLAMKVTPVLESIDGVGDIKQVEADMRVILTPPTAPVDDEADMIIDEPDVEQILKRAEEVDSGAVETLSMEEMEAQIEKSDESGLDEELDALLAATPAPVAAAPKAAVKPVTPTKKTGALNTFIDADKLQEDLSFTESSLSMAMTRQAALFAHYARLSADATYQSDRAKQQVELLEAQLNQKFRDSMVMAGTKFTEKAIDSMVIQDSSYQAAQERAHEARAIASMVATAADSFRHRKDMLIQVGADMRLEKQGELRMKEHPGLRAVDNMGS